MREIKYTVSVDSITPVAMQDAGFQCEYNATRVVYLLDERLCSAIKKLDGEVQYVLEAINGEGILSVYCLEAQESDGGLTVSMVLPETVTIPGTRAQLQLAIVALDEQNDMTAKLYIPPTTVKFGRSVTGQLIGTKEYERYSRNLVGAMQLAVSAAETASQAADSAANAHSDIVAVGEQTVQAAIDAQNAAQSAAQQAAQAAERAETAAAGGEWESLLDQPIVLETAVPKFSEQVELRGDTSKGIRVKVTLPANTTLPSNRLTARISFPKDENGVEKVLPVRAAEWTAINAITTAVFDIVPKAGVWNVDIYPYVKSVATVEGDIRYASTDKVRYVILQTNDTNPIPAGTTIEIWRLK